MPATGNPRPAKKLRTDREGARERARDTPGREGSARPEGGGPTRPGGSADEAHLCRSRPFDRGQRGVRKGAEQGLWSGPGGGAPAQGVVEVLRGDGGAAAARRADGGLIADGAQVRAARARRQLGERVCEGERKKRRVQGAQEVEII